MSKSSMYLEQLDRVRRWYNRFKNINDGIVHNQPSEYYQDEVYAFFLNCYHLKDWIKNDSAAASVAVRVEQYINNTAELSLCADICNGLKHLKLRKNKSGESPKFGSRKFELNIGPGSTTIAVKYSVDTSSGPIDAFDLATRCMEAWEKFFSSIQ